MRKTDFPDQPRNHYFVFYGDCCSGIPGAPAAANFARVNASISSLDPKPDFIVFLGDHVEGSPGRVETLSGQWQHWLREEMAWLNAAPIPIYQVTSNHDTYDADSEAVWRNVFPDIPSNGPQDQKGLSYWIRRDNLLLVVVNTSFSGNGGYGHVETEWLEVTLKEHSDAEYKLVAGHHPMFPVNGFDERPLWCVVQDEADSFWDVLVSQNVQAYLCSHIIAFDLQEHAGVLQICSGGAGTEYGATGFMGEDGYHHFVEAELRRDSFRIRTIDDSGNIRECFQFDHGT